MKVIVWKCHKCKEINVSRAREHHNMDICRCKQSGIDLEEYCTRIMGSVKILKKRDDSMYSPNTELSLCWLNQFGGQLNNEYYNQLKKIEKQIWTEL
jgi:hypothetical protein